MAMMHSSCSRWFCTMSRSAPVCVVEMSAALDAELLGDRDLHMLDETAAPQRLEQRIAEAQRHQILHRLLAEIVIDAVDLLLGEDDADVVIDQIRRKRRRCPSGFSSTTRDSGVTRPAFARLSADDGEQGSMPSRRRTRARNLRGRCSARAERGIVLQRRGVDLEVIEQRAEACHVRGVEFLAEKFAGRPPPLAPM